MKPVTFTRHALARCEKRGVTQEEVLRAVREGKWEPAKAGKFLCRLNTTYEDYHHGKYYRIKQVAPIIADEADELVVITVYTFYIGS